MRALLVVLALALAGCSGPTDTPSDTTEVSEQTRLPARGWFELNLEMEEGGAASWSFESTRALTWDVHTHVGEEVEILDNGTGAAASGSFTATRAGVYSLYVQNPANAPANLTYQARGQFTVAS